MDSEPEVKDNSPESLVTEEQVKTVLLEDKGKDAQLISWKIVNFTKKGDNYACVVTSIEVKYFNNGLELKTVYVVKLNPRKGANAFKDITSAIFIKEARFYLDLLPELNSVMEAIGEPPLKFPKCFHSSLEMDEEQIYFEDLRQRGFKMFDRKKGMDVTHTTLVLKELARLHAASLLLQAKYVEPLEVKHDFLLKDWLSFSDDSKDFLLPLIEGNLTNSIKMLQQIGGYEKAVSWIKSLKPQLEDIFSNELRNSRYDVVCHGDCWNNNVLFRYNSAGVPVEVILLDLQVCRIASPATDLNYLLYTSLTGDVRRPNLSSFLSIYYNSFKEVIDAGGSAMPFSEDEILKEFRAKNKVGGLFGMMAIPIVLMESEVSPDMKNSGVQIDELMEEVKKKSLGMLDTNPLMKPRFLAIFDEFMETGLIS